MRRKSWIIIPLFFLMLAPAAGQQHLTDSGWNRKTSGKEYNYARETEMIKGAANDGSGQAVQRKIPDEQWQQYASDKDFRYDKEVELSEQPTRQTGMSQYKWLKKFIAFLTGGFGVFLMWALIGAAAVFVVYMVVQHQRSKHRNTANGKGLADAPVEDIEHLNWADLLSRAQQKGDQREIVRCSFMLLLQILAGRQLITYRKDKTNYEYYRELKDAAIKQEFRSLSTRYEYVWYGQFTLNADAMEGYMDSFNRLRKKLSHH